MSWVGLVLMGIVFLVLEDRLMSRPIRVQNMGVSARAMLVAQTQAQRQMRARRAHCIAFVAVASSHAKASLSQ